MTIGQRIKARREELHMSQDELAKRIGYKSRSSINKIELDLYALKQSKIKSIADALDTTPSYIMGWEEEKAAPAKSEGAQAHYNVPAEYFTLSAANRQAVDILIKNLASTQSERLDSIASDLTQTTQGAFPCPTYKK